MNEAMLILSRFLAHYDATHSTSSSSSSTIVKSTFSQGNCRPENIKKEFSFDLKP
jgi:hypothetical protein